MNVKLFKAQFNLVIICVALFVVSPLIAGNGSVPVSRGASDEAIDPSKTVLLILIANENTIRLGAALLKSIPFRSGNTSTANNNGYFYELLSNNEIIYKGSFSDPLDRMNGARVSEETITLKTPYFSNTENLLFRYRKMNNNDILSSGEFNITFQ